MTSDECKQALFDAARLRFPSFGQDDSVMSKVESLEDYAIQAAQHRATLEEARLYMSEAQHRLSKKWEAVVGWEALLPGGKRRKDATKDDIIEAKRLAEPDLHEALSDAKHLISQLSLTIRRLEKDEDRVSRIYTFLTGN